MSPETSWCSIENAVENFCVETSRILKWVEDGSIRSEQPDSRMMRIKVVDLERMVQYEKKCDQAFRNCD
jgi:hypothetical protein